MKEISTRIVNAESVDYLTLYIFVSKNTPAEFSNRSDFIDHFHQINHSNEFSGLVLLAEEIPIALLYFLQNQPPLIKLIFSDPIIEYEQSIGLLLHYHSNNYQITTSELRFELWSHQNELIGFLQSRK